MKPRHRAHVTERVNEVESGVLAGWDAGEENPTEAAIRTILAEILPAKIAEGDAEIVRRCEAALGKHGYTYPNRVSGLWEPLSEPENELQVREMYAGRLPEFGYRIVRSREAFPDWLLLDADGRYVYAEVEYASSAFRVHGHDPGLCDLIVCYRHDLPAEATPVRVLELGTGLHHDPPKPPHRLDRSRLMQDRGSLRLRASNTSPERVAEIVEERTRGGEKKSQVIKEMAEALGVTRRAVQNYVRRFQAS
jgi:hypothetical protein